MQKWSHMLTTGTAIVVFVRYQFYVSVIASRYYFRTVTDEYNINIGNYIVIKCVDNGQLKGLTEIARHFFCGLILSHRLDHDRINRIEPSKSARPARFEQLHADSSRTAQLRSV